MNVEQINKVLDLMKIDGRVPEDQQVGEMSSETLFGIIQQLTGKFKDEIFWTKAVKLRSDYRANVEVIKQKWERSIQEYNALIL